jgi:hypothetical protein
MAKNGEGRKRLDGPRGCFLKFIKEFKMFSDFRKRKPCERNTARREREG